MINIKESQGQNLNRGKSPNQGIEKKTSTAQILGIISLALGVLSIFFVPLAIVSLILAIIALFKSKGLDDGSKIIAIIALLISSIIIITIFFNFFELGYFGIRSSPFALLPQKCVFTSGFDCTEAPYGDSNSGTITLFITNSNGYEISAIKLGSSKICKKFDSSLNPFPNGETAKFTLSDCSLVSGDRFEEEVVITYINPYAETKQATGRIWGKAS